MVRRVCRGLPRREVMVLNDEAHHCYLAREEPEELEAAKLKGQDKKDAETAASEGKVWATGLQQVAEHLGLKRVVDLSATPFFIDGSGYQSGRLFPWVVSDFSLVDAIESGIVKIPRVPVDDDAVSGGTGTTYRQLWPRIADALPKRAGDLVDREPVLPSELEGALRSLYGNYARAFERWDRSRHRRAAGEAPPVFIVVCNNTTTSRLVHDWIAGWEADTGAIDGDGAPEQVRAEGNLRLFSNVEAGVADATQRRWLPHPHTILVDSRALESGEDKLPKEFRRVYSSQIEVFKDELWARGEGDRVERLGDGDLLREVMNTVGKPGRLGADVRCVVSVSMLTEGWDANNVSHILGVRAFSTQLLCEQVVGRGLRRRSYVADKDGRFAPEYAEVYGVPFSFIPTSGTTAEPKPPPERHLVRSRPDSQNLEIAFPQVVGYRYELPPRRLYADFGDLAPVKIDLSVVPDLTEVAGIVGATEIHDLSDLRSVRMQTITYRLAREVLRRLAAGKGDLPHLFPQVRRIAERWIEAGGIDSSSDGAFPQMVLFNTYRDRAVTSIHNAIISAGDENSDLPFLARAILSDGEPIGETSRVEFETTRDVWPTSPQKSPVDHVVLDSGWEQTVAQRLERIEGVRSYVRNDHLGFRIPYEFEGRSHSYEPDFLVSLDVVDGSEPQTIIVEVSGQDRDGRKQVKVETARELWVPAVNAHGGFGRWAMVEITDPGEVEGHIANSIASLKAMVRRGAA